MQVDIQDATGRSYKIDSSDPETLSRWLWETLQRVGPTGFHPAYVRIWSGVDLAGNVDFAPGFQVVAGGQTPMDNVRGLISALSQFADGMEPPMRGSGS